MRCGKIKMVVLPILARRTGTRYREIGGGRKRGEGMGKWCDILGGVVVGGVGGSTGCPEGTEVSRGRCKRGKEWQRMFVFR